MNWLFPARQLTRTILSTGHCMSRSQVKYRMATNGTTQDDSWMEKAPPVDMRQYFRAGNEFKKPTAGLCQGFLQANLAMLHKSLAGNFSEFCRANPGPLPVVYQSDVGQFSAPKLSTDSDIRTDLARYRVYEDGILKKEVGDLLGYGDKMKDYVFFYFGCSFSFDLALLEAKIPLRCLEQNCNVSMYRTNIRMHAVGEFDCPMVVSMRPIPKSLVEKSFRITHPMDDLHGAPIHIGDPAAIGIVDIGKPDYGNVNRFHDGDVAVFWGCGVTGVQAILSAKPPLAFTHCPGLMYISDTPVDMSKQENDSNNNPADLPVVIPLQEIPYLASVTSEATVDKIKRLEQLAFEDPGNRQIGKLLISDDLLKSALSLSHSSSVAIIAGMPCVQDNSHPYESDGISGAIAIATIMQAIGKQTTLVVEKGLCKLMKQLVAALLEKGLIKQDISVEQYPPANATACIESARSFLTENDGVTPRYDHLVALERTGQGSDGKHYTMHARDISPLVDSSDYLFDAARELPRVFTTGIGDGGNELGMGKVYDKVVKSVPQGETIACKTSCDYLITCGLCDWGGFALSVAIYLLRMCPIHDRYQRRAVGFPPTDKEKALMKDELPSIVKERKILEVLLKHGFHDGISGSSSMTVDALPFDGVIDSQIKQMLEVQGVLSCNSSKCGT